jgi:hypothetical protein
MSWLGLNCIRAKVHGRFELTVADHWSMGFDYWSTTPLTDLELEGGYAYAMGAYFAGSGLNDAIVNTLNSEYAVEGWVVYAMSATGVLYAGYFTLYPASEGGFITISHVNQLGAATITRYGSAIGRKHRGRVYFPGWVTGTNGGMDSIWQSNLIDVAAEMLEVQTPYGHEIHPILTHRTDPITFDFVVDTLTRAVPAVQTRRRNNRA